MLIRSAGPVAQNLVVRKLAWEVYFPFPGRLRESRSNHLVRHRDDPVSTTDRLVLGDILHFEPYKRIRNVGLSDVVRGVKFFEKLLSTFYCVDTSG